MSTNALSTISKTDFNYNNFILIVFNFNSSSDKFQLSSYDCILKMMSWLSSTCIQNFPSSLVFILEIDNYLKHTEIALFRQYITKIVWPFGQRYFLDTWWNESLILYMFLFQQASLSYLKTGVIPHSNNNQQLSVWHLHLWLVAYSAPSHYLNQCRLITVDWTFGNNFQWNWNKQDNLLTIQWIWICHL